MVIIDEDGSGPGGTNPDGDDAAGAVAAGRGAGDYDIDVNLSRGPLYGDTLSWDTANKPGLELQPVHVQTDLDLSRFNKLFVDLMTAPPQVPSK